METIISIKPLLAVLVSLFVIPVLVSSSGKPNVRESWIFVAGAIKLVLVLSMLPVILGGKQIVLTLFEIAPGAAIAFRVDGLGMLFAIVAASLYIVTSIYSIGYMRGLNEHGQTRFVSFFALAISATIGAAFSANLLTLYLFYEILSLATYPLVTHHQDATSRISGRRYLTFILGTSIALVLPAMIYCYHVTGTLEFSTAGIFTGQLSKPAALVLLLMFVFGFAKAGIMPFHTWLPAAMVAPTPVSALLHAVAVVKVGVFSIVRVITGIFGVDLLADFNLGVVVMSIASVTILVSSCIALSQDELKRRLAYSTISQLSYIIFGVALLSPQGLTGGVIHIAMHAFGKITLFFCAGAIFVATGKKYISQMQGLGKKMPFTFAAFFVGALGVIGLPPTGGFYSKWNLILGTLEAQQTIFMLVLLVSSFLNAFYFLPIVFKAFFGKSEEEDNKTPVKIQEANLCLVIPLIITAIISVVLFFYPTMFVNLIKIGLSI
ncbi:MAG: monovalent cation/H+ antiporter subunit D family protein [Desulfobacula sp.]|uniref:monovalent cation/H+ antiporter subunit D family protein n=1 Tax=Desulfobacula sp. TaxID=2593537 RepID=UPI001EBF481D|nr:monovalent cation/H+ antiporter subunit D family protein [Desulfobacula sp.]MBT3485381.1 monovalent cation/H+ antiporter subunit D family protein [Desulfobacula sp.]MBT3805497.1 monovalent cation/H+ antiporter subunit D family protein [Desulfobacula sp.]MBT4873903.1 monovalent cation/H+ antiporter subunit D family protein [Desulfobacula sp.]MBT5973433.1 monovalent cation/H+ antiporter subunit D family protein [Desulfobacula sp.]